MGKRRAELRGGNGKDVLLGPAFERPTAWRGRLLFTIRTRWRRGCSNLPFGRTRSIETSRTSIEFPPLGRW